MYKKNSSNRSDLFQAFQLNFPDIIQVMDNDGLPGICEAGSFPLWITLLQNSESRTQELLLSFNSASNRRAWADLLTPQPSQVTDLLTPQPSQVTDLLIPQPSQVTK